MTGTPFFKMHGLGNDFVVLDARATPLDLSLERRRAIADRRLGVGCDRRRCRRVHAHLQP
jgi:diaminopimelate epimerase